MCITFVVVVAIVIVRLFIVVRNWMISNDDIDYLVLFGLIYFNLIIEFIFLIVDFIYLTHQLF